VAGGAQPARRKRQNRNTHAHAHTRPKGGM